MPPIGRPNMLTATTETSASAGGQRTGQRRPRRTLATLTLTATAAFVLTACGGNGGSATGDDAPLLVAAAFAPLADIAASVGGDLVEVVSLTPPGVEPHDLELSADQVATIADADLVISIPGFQPAVDEAIAQQAADRSLDATSGIALLDRDGAGDPHVWLDPANVAVIAHAVADDLAAADPAHAETFQANATALADEMDAITEEYRTRLASCESTVIVTSHDAFGYLANAFGFEQTSISGISPEAEPSPARLAEIADFVTANGVTTIYSEELMSPRVAEVIADETGVQVAILSPIESLEDGETIADVMRANLDVLVAGQRCS